MAGNDSCKQLADDMFYCMIVFVHNSLSYNSINKKTKSKFI